MFCRNLLCLLTVLVVVLSLAFAEGTRTWEQSKYEDFLKGTSHGVAIASAGRLELAPEFKLTASTPSSAVWAVAIGPQGEIYAATGAPAHVYRAVAGHPPVSIFAPQELQVQALVVDAKGVLYAATNPDGKVYRIEPPAPEGGEASKATAEDKSNTDWKSSVYFDPGTKYIWSLALDGRGNLFVATGDRGEIFRVSPSGEHSLFFKSDDPHIRVLALDGAGNLIAGSDGSGLIYRITPQGTGFVLYSAPKREITSLAIDAHDNIYAAAAGEKRSTGAQQVALLSIPPAAGSSASGSGQNSTAPPAPSEPPLVLNSSTVAVAGGSEIYRIQTDGSPVRLWSSREDLVYALALDDRGHLVAGTGNRGEIFEITGREDYVDLIRAGANQVTSFVATKADGLYVSTSNLGKVFHLRNRADEEGSYESDVFDAHVFSRWGRVEFRGGGQVELFARSGNVDNPDRNWSPWKRIDLAGDARVAAPPARFVQWKAVLRPRGSAPHLDSVRLNYLEKNVAPEFDDVVVTPGTRYQGSLRPPNLDPGQRFDPQPNPVHDRQSVGVKWTVHDENDDQMVYSLYYRGDGNTRWLLLKDNIAEKFYSFDASLLPDGGYTIKVVASDAPSHSPEETLSAEKESARFELDTTPPEIRELKASRQGDQMHVEFRAVDSFSPISRAEYSVDAGEWHLVEPVGEISDAKSESYDFRLKLPPQEGDQEHVIVVRAYDRYENMVSAKTVSVR